MKYLLVRLHLLPSPRPLGLGMGETKTRGRQPHGSPPAGGQIVPSNGFPMLLSPGRYNLHHTAAGLLPTVQCTVLLTLVTLREEARVWDKEIITII